LDYFQNFLTEEEAAKVVRTVDCNPWVKVIRRRQQFYGQVYYHTTRENAALQPGADASWRTLPISQFDWLKEKIESPRWKRAIFGDAKFPTQILVNECV
jgi:hypothetical protein